MSTLPSLDAIQARADAAAEVAVSFPERGRRSRASAADVPALVAAVRAVLALHTADYEPEDGLVCNECSTFETAREWPCETVRAITAHIDTTPKEKP